MRWRREGEGKGGPHAYGPSERRPRGQEPLQDTPGNEASRPLTVARVVRNAGMNLPPAGEGRKAQLQMDLHAYILPERDIKTTLISESNEARQGNEWIPIRSLIPTQESFLVENKPPFYALRKYGHTRGHTTNASSCCK